MTVNVLKVLFASTIGINCMFYFVYISIFLLLLFLSFCDMCLFKYIKVVTMNLGVEDCKSNQERGNDGGEVEKVRIVYVVTWLTFRIELRKPTIESRSQLNIFFIFIIPQYVQWFSEKSICNITDCTIPQNHKRSLCKKSWDNTIVYRFLQSFWFHTQREDEVKDFSPWSPHKKCYSHNNTL